MRHTKDVTRITRGLKRTSCTSAKEATRLSPTFQFTDDKMIPITR